MHCLVCHHPETKVIDSRNLNEGPSIRRRRACTSCGHRFTTYEKISVQIPMVVKEDGRRENFVREKIMKGLKKACSKREITMDMLNKLIDQLEHSICDNFRNEVPSQYIGGIVMEKLKELDPVSFVRFASFYCEFKDITGFIETIQTKNTLHLKKTNQKKKGKVSEQLH